METFSALLVLCAGNSPVTGEFPSQRPVMRSFDVFFDLRQDKRLSKQSRCRWFETPSRSLWHHCNECDSRRCLNTSVSLLVLSYCTITTTGVNSRKGVTALPCFDVLIVSHLTRICVNNSLQAITNALKPVCFVISTKSLVCDTRWRQQMTLYEGKPLVTGGFPSQRPVTQSFLVFFDLHLSKRLNKQSRRQWFETPWPLSWRHCNECCHSTINNTDAHIITCCMAAYFDIARLIVYHTMTVSPGRDYRDRPIFVVRTIYLYILYLKTLRIVTDCIW